MNDINIISLDRTALIETCTRSAYTHFIRVLFYCLGDMSSDGHQLLKM